MSDTTMDTDKVGVLCLLSGGLDSQLAVCVLKDQGLDVHAVAFDSPFYNIEPARKAAKALSIPLHVVDFTDEIVGLLKAPPHGFGKCLNPCIDCHANMLRRAGEMLEELGLMFLATGEVLNERPMSQNRRSLQVVAEDSQHADLVLRPLSAQLLEPTRPEREGWVDRSRLLALNGRGRKPQFQLAKDYGLEEYPTPAGGCRLTEPHFTHRLQDLKDRDLLDDRRDLMLLRWGRHFRISPTAKAIIGRDQRDNEMIESLARSGDVQLKTDERIPGPTALITGPAAEEDILKTAALCAGYSDAPEGEPVMVAVEQDRTRREVMVTPASSDEREGMML